MNDFGIEKGVRKQESIDFVKNHFGYAAVDGTGLQWAST